MTWWIYALLSAFFAALTAILAKIGIKGVDPDVATALRTAVILCIAWGLVLARGKMAEVTSLSRNGLIFIALSGAATGLSWIFYFRALQIGKVSLVAPIDKASLALTILLAAVFLGEALTIKTAMGAALILAGTLVLIL
ncbi:MAG: EamA family transporter [Fibrobacteres bacterium]|nr:EamA family transporter [Fibrobacterota bacterium]